MSASVNHTPSLSIPPTQNTAPVLEFNCLYTHDIRRKQKRWQDGFLRFHTFNKRVMVYDVPRNFIGDMHWQSCGELMEGDEVMLEKDGVVVQVAEQVGATETDLTESRGSVGKKKKARLEDRSSPVRSAAVTTPSRSMAPPAPRGGAATQLKHRSLNALLGTPKGQLGKAALPARSPFEERQEVENAQWEGERPPKRQRTDAWSVTRTTSAVPPKVPKDLTSWARASDTKAATVKAKKQKVVSAGQQRLGTREVIELSDDADERPAQFLPGFSSDALAPPTSPVRHDLPSARKSLPHATKAAASEAAGLRTAVHSSSPAFQTQNPRPKSRNGKAPLKPDENSETATLHQTKSKKATVPQVIHDSPQLVAPPFLPPPSNAKASQTLRIASTAPRKKTLACIDQLATESSKPGSRSTSPGSGKARRKTQKELVEERLEKMKKRAQERAKDLNDLLNDADAIIAVDIAEPVVRPQSTCQPQTPITELTNLDQMLLKPRFSEQPRASEPSLQPAGQAELERRNWPLERVISEPPPVPEPTRRKERQFQRVASENGICKSANPKRVPGAPVRYTPSPAKGSVANDSGSRRGSIASVQSHTEQQVLPTVAEPGARQAQAAATTEQNKIDLPVGAQQDAIAASKPLARRQVVSRKEIHKSAQAALDTSANGTSTVILSRPFQAPRAISAADHEAVQAPPKPPPTAREAGPWSRDAFDLFEWRPPGWDEEDWRVTPVAPV